MKCSFGLKKLKENYDPKLLKILVLFGFLVFFEIRTCWSLTYTGHSAYGCFVAIAVPLNIPHHNAFVSYNFETAYGLPKEPKEFLPGEYQGFAVKENTNKNNIKVEVLDGRSRKASGTAGSSLKNNVSNERNPKPLIKKRAIYQMLQDKLKV